MAVVLPVLAVLPFDADANGSKLRDALLNALRYIGRLEQPDFFVTRCKTLFLLDKFDIGYG
jgi:hypothetical protein